jgi:methyltransferase (TIGR00027 family)
VIPAQPSRTAFRVALRRAAHQLIDRPPVLDDPVAIDILGADIAATLRANPRHFERGLLDDYLRAFFAVRSRFAEDHVLAARAAGVRQYVILGAGLDTYSYRRPPDAQDLRIWEVDHPATQAWKRQLLRDAGIAVPDGVSYVPVDFERDSLADALAGAGFDRSAGAVVSWLGVTPYLTREAIVATLSVLAPAVGPHGGVAFDYGLTPDRLSMPQRMVFDRLAARVAAAGEPWQSFFDPDELASTLRSMGFAAAEDSDQEQLNQRYFSNRADGLQVGSLAHMMWAGAPGDSPAR